jgi:hypothetical protein
VRLVVSGGVLLTVYLTYRTLVLQGVGGYDLNVGSPLASVAIMTSWFFLILLQPYPLAAISGAGDVAANAVAGVFGIAFVLMSAMVLTATLRSGRRGAGRSAGIPVLRDRDRAELLALWILPGFVFYTMVFALTGVFKSLYAYSLLPAWCTLFGVTVVAVWDRAIEGTRHGPARFAPALSLLAAAVLTMSWIRHSALGDGLRVWRSASDLAVTYLDRLESTLAGLPAGATLFLANLPREVECGTQVCAGGALTAGSTSPGPTRDGGSSPSRLL